MTIKRVVKSSLLALFSGLSAFSQAGRLDGGFVTGSSYGLYWETRLEPASPALAQNLGTAKVWNAGAAGATGTFTRILLDREHRTYFGYVMNVKAVGDGRFNMYWVQRLNLAALARELHIDDPEAWKLQLTGWGAPGEKVVRAGDVIAIDLMTNPDTGQKIVDYITIQEPFRQSFVNLTPREFSYVAGASRDFRVDDAELRIREPRLSVNGKAEESPGRQDIISPTVWVYAPGKGRFVLSLTPRAGFVKAGEVRGTSLTFKVGADTFTISSAVRIAAGDAPFNLYVLHEPAYKPAETSAFTIGQ
jgi:hypothetical protein